ncbi:MAG: hypothetical protein ACFFAK_00815 [Promethearchaeota archaeon]
MERRSLGLFLIVLGIIFLIIALITFWAMGVDWISNIYYLIFSIPLIIFSIYTIYFGLYLILKEKLNQKVKGLLLIIDGIISIIISMYILLDERFFSFAFVRNLVLFPLFLVSIFLMIYGFYLMFSERLISKESTKKRVSWILGLISTLIGLLNAVFFIIIVINFPTQPVIFLISLPLIGGTLIIFGIHLIIQGLNKTISIKK